jgi:putative DNA primase/helicase
LSAYDAFMAFIRAAGLEPAKSIDLVDGKLIRFKVAGDKPGSANGWCVFHGLPVPWGLVGSWKTGEQHHWKDEARTRYSRAERVEQQKQIEAARATRQAEQNAVQASARDRAAKLWSRAKPATGAHPYLVRKKVHAYGLKQLREALLIPARSSDGTLHTLQFIGADGGKRFLTGGRISGCYYAIGQVRECLLVCEGYATAATLHAATGEATAAAFSAGNLHRVALALRVKFPRARIVICGDDDAGTPGNPGRTAAVLAARAVGGLVALPRFEVTP